MPFDDNGYQQSVEHDVFSLEGLIAWLGKQPPDATYDFFDCSGKCLLDTYLAEHGKGTGLPNYRKIAECHGDHRNLEYKVAIPEPWTYGAALERARALLRAKP